MIQIMEIINFGDSLRIVSKRTDREEPEEPIFIQVDSQGFDLLQIVTEIKNHLEQ